jgi:hypothetical protein
MSKNPEERNGEMRAEYDFRGGIRGKYADRFAEGSNVVALDPDVAAQLKTPKAVNKALRDYLESKKRRKSGAA